MRHAVQWKHVILNECMYTTRPMLNFDLTMHAAPNELSLVLSQPTLRVGLPTKSPCLYLVHYQQVVSAWRHCYPSFRKSAWSGVL